MTPTLPTTPATPTAPTALVITLRMEEAAAARFNVLRRTHFPVERNFLDAHITLFHALPLTAIDTVRPDLADIARATRAFPLRVDRILFLGRGVAYGMSSIRGTEVRNALAARWKDLLSRQDRAWHGRLHVTVQNKVEPSVARMLQARLEKNFAPHDVKATGLQVWRYVGGPWEFVCDFDFADAPAAIFHRAAKPS